MGKTRLFWNGSSMAAVNQAATTRKNLVGLNALIKVLPIKNKKKTPFCHWLCQIVGLGV